MQISNIDKKYLIKLIESGEKIPEEYKYLLFPNLQEEYELTYAGKMRKEDILAGEDGTLPVPLQVERVFNGEDYPAYEDGWENMIVFGDNLQFLKTINENKDPLIKDKVKGKVKLIYIDPPFATQDEFSTKAGNKAYSDKKKGSEFLEFIRRRLIVAKEILADDGVIFVHIDYRYKFHIKQIMDEVFNFNFINEIIVNRVKKNVKEKTFVNKMNEEFDTLLFYSKNKGTTFIPPVKKVFKAENWHNFEASGYRTDMDYELFGVKPKSGNHWRWKESRAEKASKNYEFWKLHFSDEETIGEYWERNGQKMDFVRRGTSGQPEYFIPEKDNVLCNNVWNDIPAYEFSNNYPTEKSEKMLLRIINMCTNEGDLIMDFFGGSGTSMAVAEKLGRRWITCDLGKLSYLTMQKRLLQIKNSKCLESKTKYNKHARSFITCKLGMYDLGTALKLEWDKYKDFVSRLFEYDNKEIKTSGIKFDGEKRGHPVKVFNYMKYKDSGVNYHYIYELHKTIKSKRYSRVYIVAPATKVDFIADYEEIDNTKYYFLKVPYEMIEELHKTPFIKSRQPRSKNNVNDIEEMKGFQFIYTPEVECELRSDGKNTKLTVSKFLSDPLNGCEMNNFSTLSSIFVNYAYNGKEFLMDDVRFWSDIESNKKDNMDTTVEYKDGNPICVEWIIPTKILGEKTVFIFTDIYGNDVTVSLSKETINEK
jgi:DNA (cytosine-5-)-methyltransferase